MLLNKKNRMSIVNRQYRHLIEIWDLKNEVKNEVEELVQVPQLIDKLWADVKPVRGKEYTEHNVIIPEMTHKITTRYREHIHQGMLVKWQDKELNINAVIDINGQQESIELICTEKVDT